VQAERALLEGNVRRSDRKQKIDKLAAQIMLQSYLDATNPPPADP
jgi:RNase H-fold protein (predicted Holliday junction resolvase)